MKLINWEEFNIDKRMVIGSVEPDSIQTTSRVEWQPDGSAVEITESKYVYPDGLSYQSESRHVILSPVFAERIWNRIKHWWKK